MNPILSDRFTDALAFAHALHARQVRKGSGVPYVAHLLGVCALVLEAGGDEDHAIAALLHDAVEDQGGAPTLDEIRRRFGERVARIVAACSDSDVEAKPPWRARKEAYLAHLPSIDADARVVSLADKVHNARAIVADLRALGPSVWTRFKGERDGTLWYYEALVRVYRQSAVAMPLLDELERIVAEMKRLAHETEDA